MSIFWCNLCPEVDPYLSCRNLHPHLLCRNLHPQVGPCLSCRNLHPQVSPYLSCHSTITNQRSVHYALVLFYPPLHPIDNPRPPERTRSFPRPPRNTSPRRDTVIALYERLKECGFIQVRGTPASGKTVLAQLLADYIDHIPQQDDEKIHIVWVHGWPAKAERGDYRSYLRWLGWDEKRKKTVFIFDEAQQTYNDSELWSQFFRPMRDYEERRAIIFCGYGSPTLRVSLGGTPLLIADAQRVTLRHIDHQDGLAPVGLLFTRSEFDDLITTRYPSPTFCFDPSFFDALYGITNGHVGAIKDFISIIIADDSYRQLKRTAGRLYTWKSFLDAIGPQELLQKLEDSAIVFGRGLPSNDALRVPAIASVFSAVLPLQECFRQGWLHADKLGAMNLLDEIGYLFPSSLHRWYVEWKLSGSLPPTELQAKSLLDFVINVIKLFSPNILSTKRRLGPGCIQRLPEAQYQDEFYRCCHVLSRGSLVTFPEFGTTQGLVDFYIPTKSWGIELLREGNQLASHCGRFSEGGSYRMTLPLSEYIIIDCRTTYPKEKHPLMSNLYHAVFEDNFHNVSILDNGLSVRMGFCLLAM
ncbi:hypothetical protein F5887DRAFT_393623 [Amanita rubescens]|nr:hypothetical protein F5887DRAFT_393623 [Amanita rubescens]